MRPQALAAAAAFAVGTAASPPLPNQRQLDFMELEFITLHVPQTFPRSPPTATQSPNRRKSQPAPPNPNPPHSFHYSIACTSADFRRAPTPPR